MMEKDQSERVRSLERGLEIIEYLSRRTRTSLADLRQATGYSNATLLRLLASLQHRGWVRRNIVEGQYELSHSIGKVLGEKARAHPLAELAGPILLDLKGRQAGLPSDLNAVMGAGRIEIIESTRLRGPMAPTRTALGIRPSMVLSAHGRAILAFSPEAVAELHLESLRQIAGKEELRMIESGFLAREIEETRQRGFGLREAAYWQAPFDPGPELGAMAVPIISKSGVHGSISILWMIDDMDIDEVLAFGCLDDLQKAARRVAEVLDRERIKALDIL
ncbi:helix-turn-helix domain-containing protein [uncultured Roseibium sp.]|uniref:helix-turn-helix domain-containing protein n=1 Tax=uncultured Roseibium sp. TaxID=1936171 RepID=UPI00261059D4|nr:helix-turn-helix domain-containing protein [uncultured Roseibium sp.]